GPTAEPAACGVEPARPVRAAAATEPAEARGRDVARGPPTAAKPTRLEGGAAAAEAGGSPTVDAAVGPAPVPANEPPPPPPAPAGQGRGELIAAGPAQCLVAAQGAAGDAQGALVVDGTAQTGSPAAAGHARPAGRKSVAEGEVQKGEAAAGRDLEQAEMEEE